MELDVIVGNNVSSTGPIGQLQGMFLGPENHGVGAIDLVTGITCFVYHSGSALCGELYGFEVQVNVGNVGPATTLAAYYAKTPSFLGGGSATNVYGLLIDDQSGLGGTQSLNILSRGAGSNNLFEGKVSANVSLVGAAATAATAGGSSTPVLLCGTVAGFGIYFGSGVPTISAGQGSLYLRTDGSSGVTRAYINQNGSTTWTAINTSA